MAVGLRAPYCPVVMTEASCQIGAWDGHGDWQDDDGRHGDMTWTILMLATMMLPINLEVTFD